MKLLQSSNSTTSEVLPETLCKIQYMITMMASRKLMGLQKLEQFKEAPNAQSVL
jgi:hypothetical protein